jgi:hypothetical protein
MGLKGVDYKSLVFDGKKNRVKKYQPQDFTSPGK